MSKTTEVTITPFDLASLDTGAASDNGARIEIVHPTTKEGLGMFITVLGKHSQVFRDIIKERVDNRIKAESLAVQRGKSVPTKTAETVEREAVELLAACTIGWDTEVKDDEGEVVETKPAWFFRGEWIEFNIPNAMRVFTDLLWIREQVDNAIGDLENFIKA